MSAKFIKPCTGAPVGGASSSKSDESDEDDDGEFEIRQILTEKQTQVDNANIKISNSQKKKIADDVIHQEKIKELMKIIASRPTFCQFFIFVS